MQRRRFFELSGAAALSALTGCGGGRTSGSNTLADAWAALASSMDGALLLPGDAAYEQARLVVNTRYASVMPQSVALCATAADVAAILAVVREFGLAVTPRSGGHGFAGNSTTTGVVIDVSPMNSIQVNADGTATIGAGARLADVYDQLFAKGVAIPCGTCLSVGIAGITLGGGIGLVDRAYGLTCDNLLAAQRNARPHAPLDERRRLRQLYGRAHQ